MAGFEWDDAKSRANIIKHGVSFEAIDEFDFDTAIGFQDRRFDMASSVSRPSDGFAANFTR